MPDDNVNNHEITLESPHIIPAREEEIYPRLFLMALGINFNIPGGEASLTFVPANSAYTKFAATGHETLTGSMEEWRAKVPEVDEAWIKVAVAAKAVRVYERDKKAALLENPQS